MENNENKAVKQKNGKSKKALHSGMPWEETYGYAQALKVGRSVYISGQVGTDEKGELLSGMEAQMERSYLNIEKLLIRFGISTADVVEEVIYATDIEAAFEARAKLGKTVYPNAMEVPSTLLQVERLALSGQLVEIKIIAIKPKGKKAKATP